MKGADMRAAKVLTVRDGDLPLRAVLQRPDRRRGPLVIVLHGFSSDMTRPHTLAACEAMREAGFATLRADLYGHGGSGGAFRDHTIPKWVSNILALLAFAEGLDFVTEIWLSGHSQGGLTAMLAAAMERDVIKGLIALSPASMIPEGARKGQLLGIHFDPVHIPEEIPAWNNQTLGNHYIRVAQTIYVDEYIQRYDGPVLLVHGDADGAVLPACSIDAAKKYKNAQLVLIPNDGHCYENHLDLAVEAVKNWMEKRAR